MCGDLLDVFLQKSYFSQSLVLGYVNEFVCQQPQIIRAVSANNDAVPRRQIVRSSYPLSEVKAGVSCDPPSRCDRHDRYQFPSSRREGCFRDSEKRFGFRSLYVSLKSGFDLATTALYLLEARSNSAEFGPSINGLRQKSSMVLGLRRPLNGTK